MTAFMGVVVYEFAWLSPERYVVNPQFLLIVPILANLLVGGATWWFSDAVRISREREVQLAVERVMAEGRARIQRLLTDEQRAKSSELIGTPFVFARESPEDVRAKIRRR